MTSFALCGAQVTLYAAIVMDYARAVHHLRVHARIGAIDLSRIEEAPRVSEQLHLVASGFNSTRRLPEHIEGLERLLARIAFDLPLEIPSTTHKDAQAVA